ncbi:MAG: cytochrome c [Hyphomicrobiaceae bacterium]|nr:cytochrome c [Hyphomicrobiaceae bacterium]
MIILPLLLSSAALVGSETIVPAHALDSARESELTHLVRQDCGSCHGMTLKGGLGGPLLPESLADLESESIASIILGGVPGKPMPPWQGELSEEDAMWIADNLKKGFPQ